MNKITRSIFQVAHKCVLGLALVACGGAFAQALEKDGKPCVKEICLGDGLAELQKINWEKAREFPQGFITGGSPIVSRRADNVEVARMLNNFKGSAAAIRAASAYLPADYRSGHFDSTTLPLLSQIEAACYPYALLGRYTPQEGLPTVVSIGLFASADGNTQDWKVFQINRFFPQNMTAAQVAQVNAQVETSYKKWVDGRMNIYISTAKPSFMDSWVYFGLSLTGSNNLGFYRDESMRHALCGGKQKFRIN